jgi:hypothetical protein
VVNPSAQDSLPHPIVQVRKRVETILPGKHGRSNMHCVMLVVASNSHVLKYLMFDFFYILTLTTRLILNL